MAAFLKDYSIEVMPRTAEKIEDFRALFPHRPSRIYIAHIEGTEFAAMLATARRLAREGFVVCPHFPARLIADRQTLETWIARYHGEAGVTQGLLLAGGLGKPCGAFASSMELMETGLFDRYRFTSLFVAGHPEGNRDIDPDGSERNLMAALDWKQKFSARTNAKMAITTQFCFEAEPVIAWAYRLREAGIALPIHIGVAGPTRLQTLIRFALACGVGPSIRVLRRRAGNMARLLVPMTPDAFLLPLAREHAERADFPVRSVHLFPLGGIASSAEWAMKTLSGSPGDGLQGRGEG